MKAGHARMTSGIGHQDRHPGHQDRHPGRQDPRHPGRPIHLALHTTVQSDS